MAEANDKKEVVVEEEEETLEEEDLSKLDDTTDWKSKAEELEQKRREDGIRARERTKAIKAQLAEALKAKEEKEVIKKEAKEVKSDELDNADLALLTAKGIEADDEIALFEGAIKKTGSTLREVLKDDYYLTKLKNLRDKKSAEEATPSSNRRSGGGSTDTLEIAIAKYEKTGELPTDFALRSAVINKKVEQENTNKPAWKT